MRRSDGYTRFFGPGPDSLQWIDCHKCASGQGQRKHEGDWHSQVHRNIRPRPHEDETPQRSRDKSFHWARMADDQARDQYPKVPIALSESPAWIRTALLDEANSRHVCGDTSSVQDVDLTFVAVYGECVGDDLVEGEEAGATVYMHIAGWQVDRPGNLHRGG
jgi:hypothetical protein